MRAIVTVIGKDQVGIIAAVCALLTLPAVFLAYNATALYLCAVALCAALLGVLAGAALRRSRQGSAPPA